MTTLRVLDVGCHDGFVGRFVADRLGQAGVTVELDGVEPHPAFAQAARERGYRTVHESTMEEAPIPAGTYDAVVAYEVWEHARDPDRLLAACEQALKPDGRIYLSTPEGAFGAGSNPHHLRAVKGTDFFDVAARRGLVESFHAGQDGVNAVAYRPVLRTGTCAILCPGAWERWHPADMTTRGLGGSETAAARLADALTGLGWHVTLYGNVQTGGWRSVTLRHTDTFDPMDPVDLLLVQRTAGPFASHNRAARTALWAHDTDFGPLSAQEADRIDHVLCLSRWHERHLADSYPLVADRIARVRNGIDPAVAAAARQAAKPRQARVVYSSSPDRGLDTLLNVWPRVRDAVPDAELACCYADVYNAVADQDPAVAAHREQLRERIAATDGVTSLGSLPQTGLALLMAESAVWAHPSMTPTGPFMETSCIGAMEAQAAGCLVVASGWGALPETVQVGRLVDDGDDWEGRFADQLIEALRDTDGQAWAQQRGPEYAAGLGWAQVAQAVTMLGQDGWESPDPPDRRALSLAADG